MHSRRGARKPATALRVAQNSASWHPRRPQRHNTTEADLTGCMGFNGVSVLSSLSTSIPCERISTQSHVSRTLIVGTTCVRWLGKAGVVTVHSASHTTNAVGIQIYIQELQRFQTLLQECFNIVPNLKRTTHLYRTVARDPRPTPPYLCPAGMRGSDWIHVYS